MPTTITATEARVHFGAVLRRVAEDGEIFIVTKNGKPVAVILPIKEYERLKAARGSAESDSSPESIRS